MKQFICITCPTGCRLEAELVGDKLSVTGNACKRGKTFALAELTHPMRSLTSTVRTAAGEVLPVRTDREIPKEAVGEVMRLLAGITVERPTACGEIIAGLAPLCEGNIIATCDYPF